jgi:alpha-2-macroglobulin
MKKWQSASLAAAIVSFIASLALSLIGISQGHVSAGFLAFVLTLVFSPTLLSFIYFIRPRKPLAWLSSILVALNALLAAFSLAVARNFVIALLFIVAAVFGIARIVLMLKAKKAAARGEAPPAAEEGLLHSLLGKVRVEYEPPTWAARLIAASSRGARSAFGRAARFVSKRIFPLFGFKGPKGFVGYGLVAAILAAILAPSLFRPAQQIDFSIKAPGIKSSEEGASAPALDVTFGGPAARIDLVGKEVASGLSIEPRIEGRWFWSSDRELLFFPSHDWAIGQEYKVAFDASVFSDKVSLKRRSASFSTPSFALDLESKEFYVDPSNPNVKRIVLGVSFNYAPDHVQFEKAVKLGMPFTVAYDDHARKAYVSSAPIPVPAKAYMAKVGISGNVSAQAGGSPFRASIKAEVQVPGLYDGGSITGVETTAVRSESYEYRKMLIVSASLAVKPEALRDAIEAYLLPVDRPESPGTKKDERHAWRMEEIDPSVLALSQRLPLEIMPIETEYGKELSYAYEAPSGRCLYVRQTAELAFLGGYKSKARFADIATVPQIPKEIKIMHDGSILSMSGERTISLFSNDLDDVLFEVGRIIPDQVNHLITQTDGDFKNPIFQSYDFGLDNISATYSQEMQLKRLDPGKVQYFSFDFDTYLHRESDPRLKYGLFYFKASEYDPKAKKTSRTSDRRLILVTDLGILVKRGAAEDYDLFVQSIYSGAPIAGASVEVVGKNGLPVLSSSTDEGGRVHIPKLSGFTREKAPVVFVVKKGSDMSFLPVKGKGRFLNYSRFDVGGLVGSADPGFVDAYLFSDRGIYRPGEEARIGLIVKAGSWERSLAGLPLELSVEDPRGLEVQRKKLTLPASGFDEYSWRSLDSSPTGKYEIKLFLARDKEEPRLLGGTSIKVEEFRPDRLSIRSKFLAEPGKAWISPKDLRAEVDLMNLYGGPASGNEVVADMQLSPAALYLDKYPDYVFHDPYAVDKSASRELGQAATDARGSAAFPIDLADFDKATYLLRFTAEGMEKEGGRSVIAQSSIVVSPLSAVVGYKADGDLGYVARGAARSIRLVAVDSSQRGVALKGLALSVVESRYVSVLEKGPDGLYRYKSVEKKLPVLSRDFAIPAAGVETALPTGAAGDFEVTISDASGTKLNGFKYSVVGGGNLARSLDKNAELQIKLDRKDYAVGDTIRVSIKAPYVGSGLVTIERDKVYAYSWFKAGTNASVQSIVVPAGLEGTAYVNVSFVRAIDSREIYASPLSYGVAPFSISRERRTNRISLSVPDELRGGSTLKIAYSSQRPGKIILFGVDEGILQVARYGEPKPLDHFFTKRALEVSTLQILDLILPEYSIVRALSAAGGDAEGPGRNINPFKRKNKPPVAFWSGILPCDRTERSFEYPVPDWFNGGIKVMAVVVSDDSIGTASKTARVRNDYVISPNVPATVSPGDEFEVGVRVLNDAASAGTAATKVELELEASPQLEVLKGGSVSASLKRGEEGTFFFRLRAKDQLGEASLKFSASGGGAASALSESISLRPAMPYRVQLDSGRIVNGEKEIPLDRKLHAEFRKVEASASYLPTGMSLGLKDYLDEYPYGCTEQIVSRAFPAIALRSMPDFGVSEAEARERFTTAQGVLRARQNQEGGFGLWAANDDASSFVTAYAMHFLTDARDAGFPVDGSLLGAGLNALKAIASAPASQGSNHLAAAYATYVLTRNGVVTTNYVSGILASKNLPRDWKESPIAAYLAGAYAIMKQSGEARSLLSSAFAGRSGEDDFFNGLANSGLCLYLASRHAPSSAGGIAGKALEGMAADIARSKYNTISSCYAILGLCAYAAEAGQAGRESTRLEVKAADGTYRNLPMEGSAVRRAKPPYGSAAVKFADKTGDPLYYGMTQAGFDLAPPKSAVKKGIEVYREYCDSSGKAIGSVPIGGQVYVHVKARTVDPKRKLANDVAIVDLLPAGFELVDEGGDGPAAGAGKLKTRFIERREDRVLIFCEVEDGVREFTYAIKATNRGRFTIPPAFAESMYDLGTWSMAPSPGALTVAGD